MSWTLYTLNWRLTAYQKWKERLGRQGSRKNIMPSELSLQGLDFVY